MLVIADERFANLVVGEEFLRVARILTRNFIHFFEDAKGAKSDVFKVAYGRTDEIEAAEGAAGAVVCCGGGHEDESSTRGKSVGVTCYTFLFGENAEGASVPLYEYKCLKCGRLTEKIEAVSGPHLKKCPHCGGKVESVISAPAIQFKGSGWYVTDYAGKSADGGSKEAKANDGKEAGGAGSDAKDSGGNESAGKESSEKATASQDKNTSSKDKKTIKKP